jgi:hypothetical protein
VHVGPIDTDMSAELEVVKSSPEFVARAALDALERGDTEVLVDAVTRGLKAALSGPPPPRYRLGGPERRGHGRHVRYDFLPLSLE